METQAVPVGWFIWQSGWRMSSGNHGEDWKFKSLMQLFNCVQVTLLQSVKCPKMSSTVHCFCGTSCKWYLKTVRTLKSKSTVRESARVEMIPFGCDYAPDLFILHRKISDFKMPFIAALWWRRDFLELSILRVVLIVFAVLLLMGWPSGTRIEWRNKLCP